MLEQALRSGISDFEDAVLEQAGRLVAVDAITTRNVTDFRKSTVTVYDPIELIATVKAMESANKAMDSDEESRRTRHSSRLRPSRAWRSSR